MTNKSLSIYTDGGARGNPGPAAIGVVIKQGSHTVHEFGKTIGEATNNVAEYSAVIEALKYVLSANLVRQRRISLWLKPCLTGGQAPAINFFIDSNLVVQQLNGFFKVKDAKLRVLMFDVHSLVQEVGGVVTFTYIPREKNYRADYLLNQALD